MELFLIILKSYWMNTKSMLEYTKRIGDNLIKLYTDEGLSAAKIINRKGFQCILADAGKLKLMANNNFTKRSLNNFNEHFRTRFFKLYQIFEVNLNSSSTMSTVLSIGMILTRKLQGNGVSASG